MWHQWLNNLKRNKSVAQLKLQEYFLCAMKTKITILFNNYSPLGYCLRRFGEYHNAYACFSLSVNNADYVKYVHACTFPRNVHNTDYIGYSPKHVKCFKFKIFIYYLFKPFFNYWKQNWIFLENCLFFFIYIYLTFFSFVWTYCKHLQIIVIDISHLQGRRGEMWQ